MTPSRYSDPIRHYPAGVHCLVLKAGHTESFHAIQTKAITSLAFSDGGANWLIAVVAPRRGGDDAPWRYRKSARILGGHDQPGRGPASKEPGE